MNQPPFLIALLAAVLKIAVVVGTIMLVVPMIVWLERKVMADMQSRVGPNRVGPWGLLQSFADGIKLLAKESILPVEVDKFLYFLAPVISMVPALAVAAVIPFGGDLHLGKYTYRMVIADLPVGFLFVLALTSLSVYGIVLSGWASNNKYSLLGGLRSSAQMVSYELPMGLSVIAAIMIASYASTSNLFSLSLRDVVDLQKGGVLHWGAFNYHFPFLGFLAMITFYIGGLAETNRAPFDLPEAESELIGGYHTEYGGMKWAMFFLGEYGAMLNVAAMTTVLFLGGWHGPFPHPIFDWGTVGYCLEGVFWYCFKVFVILYIYIWIRATLPRIRYDRLMGFAWKYLLPTTLLNVLAVAAILTVGFRQTPPQVLARNEPELAQSVNPPPARPSFGPSNGQSPGGMPGGFPGANRQFPSAPLGRGRSGFGNALQHPGSPRGGRGSGALGSSGAGAAGRSGAPGLHVIPGGAKPAPGAPARGGK